MRCDNQPWSDRILEVYQARTPLDLRYLRELYGSRSAGPYLVAESGRKIRAPMALVTSIRAILRPLSLGDTLDEP